MANIIQAALWVEEGRQVERKKDRGQAFQLSAKNETDPWRFDDGSDGYLCSEDLLADDWDIYEEAEGTPE